MTECGGSKLPSYGTQSRNERSSMAMSPLKSSPTVPSTKICPKKKEGMGEGGLSEGRGAEWRDTVLNGSLQSLLDRWLW